jgi:outer membrane murein-binding lipoprotein Lpp
MIRKMVLIGLVIAAGCSSKETPEQAAERIRDTIAAMQSLSAEEQKARSVERYDRLAKHADSIAKGMAFAEVNSLLGVPVQSRVKDGAISQAWSGTKDGKTITLAVRFEQGLAVDVMISRKP